jgi:hypothetical protein
MKSSQIFVFIFIGFLVALIHEAATTEDVTDVVSTATATQAGEATTAGSSNTDVPTGESGTTDGSVTQASSGTNPPQSTVPGSTVAPPTTAASCPSQDIIAVKDSGTPAFQLNIPPGLECTYYARSTSFTKSILIQGPVVAQGPGGKLQIFGDDGNSLYDSSNNPTMNDISTKSSQIKMSVTTTTDSFEITINMALGKNIKKDSVIKHLLLQKPTHVKAQTIVKMVDHAKLFKDKNLVYANLVISVQNAKQTLIHV